MRKVKKGNQRISELANQSLVRKRSCEDSGGEQDSKRYKGGVMWRDDEGDVVEVETDLIIDEEAGLPEQPRQTK